MVVAWKNDPVTKEALNIINEFREDVKEYIALGYTLSVENPVVDTAQMVGRVQGYDHCLDLIEELKVKAISEGDSND